VYAHTHKHTHPHTHDQLTARETATAEATGVEGQGGGLLHVMTYTAIEVAKRYPLGGGTSRPDAHHKVHDKRHVTRHTSHVTCHTSHRSPADASEDNVGHEIRLVPAADAVADKGAVVVKVEDARVAAAACDV